MRIDLQLYRQLDVQAWPSKLALCMEVMALGVWCRNKTDLQELITSTSYPVQKLQKINWHWKAATLRSLITRIKSISWALQSTNGNSSRFRFRRFRELTIWLHKRISRKDNQDISGNVMKKLNESWIKICTMWVTLRQKAERLISRRILWIQLFKIFISNKDEAGRNFLIL